MTHRNTTIVNSHKNRTAIVTGATSGIGYELVRQLSQAGWQVIAIGRNLETLQALSALSDTIKPVAFDFAKTSDIAALANGLMTQFGNIDVLINNAAIQIDRPFPPSEGQHLDATREILINLAAPIELTGELLPFFLDANAGHIINISSGLALAPKRTAAVYCATKAGLSMFSQALRLQLQETKVSVVDLILPLVATPMTEGRGNGKISAEAAARAILRTLDGRSKRVYVGKAKILALLMAITPWLARWIMRGS